MPYTALIIGGGIAGLSSAIALRKAGIGVVVHEAHDRAADEAGAFLTLAVNALDALRAMDLDVGGLGVETPKITLAGGSGRRLGELPYTMDGLTSRTVKRGDLNRFLRERALARGVRIEYGKRLADAAVTGDGVVARFADGTTAAGDLLIGADGLRSRTRRIIDPAAPTARYTGLLTTGGYARATPTGPRHDPAPGMHAIFGRRCFLAYLSHPDGEVWWAANPVQPAELTPAELAAVDWRTRLSELFRRDRGPALDLIAATDEIFPGWNSYDVPTVPIWHRDRMIVIGDAAHATAPSIGQGAALAIEDAVVLARCLRDGPGIEAAFGAYERARRERVERVVEQGNRTGGWKALGPVASVPRDLIMSWAMRRMARTGDDPSRWIYAHHIEWHARAA
ncbi:FAD-dependent monooxygenase [Nonomuraea jiangxiensis]|uniref:2-polyprenyl-6-methoxyphenol hydroxylase n=1 Tax=Nonomuraea jiangxiensis TaxID=633440 RepID=A0A1G9AYR3_9ACTN|nr:FAD-dependent monooxygenase [Nonomuraea jiangxiensis]SDK32407.1 2-polyprenyl-6-methoxyphenol hydroxylase [Nonomuraea jiangxiensis]